MKKRRLNTIHSVLTSALSPALGTMALLFCAGLTALHAEPGNDNRAPSLTGTATNIIVTNGNKVCFHVYAVGVQIYTNDPITFAWGLKAPEAVLFDADGNIVGVHYAYGYTAAGAPIPAWETRSGSLAVGMRLMSAPGGSGNIAWLLLQAVHTEGPGVLQNTTYIQRVNTSGGVAPAVIQQPGQEVRVPYTAEYFFYREVNLQN